MIGGGSGLLRPWGIHHAVEGGDPVVVRPARHEIAQVDDETPRHNGHIDPLAGLVVDLQPARLVLGFEDREAAVVAMGPGAELARLGRMVGAG